MTTTVEKIKDRESRKKVWIEEKKRKKTKRIVRRIVDLKQICHSKLKNKNRKYQKYDKMFLTTKTLSNWRYFL